MKRKFIIHPFGVKDVDNKYISVGLKTLCNTLNDNNYIYTKFIITIFNQDYSTYRSININIYYIIF